MVFQKEYEWQIQNIESFLEGKPYRTIVLDSPVFYASPDDVCHRWKVSLSWIPTYPEHYGNFLHLDDEPIQQPISAKTTFKVYNQENQLVFEETAGEFHEFKDGYRAWGNYKAIDRSKCNIKSIKRINFNIEIIG